MEEIILLAVVCICSVSDIKKKSLSVRLLAASGAVLALSAVMFGGLRLADRLGGALVGIAVLAASRLTRGAIGSGDGVLICLTGISAGFAGNMMMLCFACFGAGLFSAAMIAAGKLKKHDRLPFVPFLAAGCLGVMLTYAQRA